jgi:lipoate-protein ligase A
MKTTLVTGSAGIDDWGLERSADLLASERLLSLVSNTPSMGRIVRIYRPEPTVAFSGFEQRLAGFDEAVGEALAFGFEPVVRPAGGRMVALDEEWVVVDIITPERYLAVAHRDVYEESGNAFVSVLRNLGLDASIGAVAGEYCPGDYSINARGAVKIVGTAQRVRRGARLFSACIPFSISYNVATLFERINASLQLDWNPATLAGVKDEAPRLRIEDLENALIERFAPEAEEATTLSDIYRDSRELSQQLSA